MTLRFASVGGIVCNGDFATPATDIPALVHRYNPKWFATQESKGIGGYARRLAHTGVAVRQDMSSIGSQGVTVGWDRNYFQAIRGRGHHGWMQLVDGHGIEARGVVWQDGRVRSTGRRFRLASAHRPPIRYRHLWAAFDDHLHRWSLTSPYALLLGMDSNEEGGPGHPLTDSHLAWHGHRIDGVLTDLKITEIRDLPEGSSDHHPLLVSAYLR